MRKSIVGLIAILAAAPATAQTPGDCAMYLDGLMTTEVLLQNEAGSTSYHRFECSTQFRTAQDLTSFGFKLPIVYQGATVTPELAFDQQKSEDWKAANCSAEDRAASVAREVASMRNFFPEEGWRALEACYRAIPAYTLGMHCRLEDVSEDVSTMQVTWRPYDNLDTKLPTLTSFDVLNATVVGSPPPLGSQIQNSLNITLQRSGAAPIVVTLNTDRRACPPVFSPKPVISYRIDRVVLTAIGTQELRDKIIPWRITDQDTSRCDIGENRGGRVCVDDPRYRLVDNRDLATHGARCGSQYDAWGADPNDPKCGNLAYTLRGCGWDFNQFGIKVGCKGTAYLDITGNLIGARYEPWSQSTDRSPGIRSDSYVLDSESRVPDSVQNISWTYQVSATKMFGDRVVELLTLDNNNVAIGGLSTELQSTIEEFRGAKLIIRRQ